jgi:hypothetical protein
MDTPEVEALLHDTFDDMALLIGGTAALHPVEDDFVRSLLRRLERVRNRAFSRLPRVVQREGRDSSHPCPLHSAVEDFLSRGQEDRSTRGSPSQEQSTQKYSKRCTS